MLLSFAQPVFHPKPFWINGRYIQIDGSRLYDFFHDLPWLGEFSESDQTAWLSYLGDPDLGNPECFFSAWTHDYVFRLLQMRLVASSLAFKVLSETSPALPEIKKMTQALQVVNGQINLMLSAVEGSQLVVWGINLDLMSALNESDISKLLQWIPHFSRERASVEGEIKMLVKANRRVEASINKLVGYSVFNEGNSTKKNLSGIPWR